MDIIISFVGIAVLGIINGILAARKGYTFLSWFFAAGPVGTGLLLALPDTQRIPVRIKKGDRIGIILTVIFFAGWFIFMTGGIVMGLLTTLFFAMFLAGMG